MRIIIFTQCYWPDTVSVAQHLSELCERLAAEGHAITVLTSRFSYENKSITFSTRELHKKVNIYRTNHTSFGKKNHIGRALDFVTFIMSIGKYLINIKKTDYDLVMAMPPPPLLPFFASYIAKKKKIPFIYWAMDLQPELSYATGLLKANSIIGNILDKMTKLTISNSSSIVALDDDMKNYLISKNNDSKNVVVCPVWTVMEDFYEGSRMENPFRKKYNFKDKIVIMYSGNYGDAHPVDTLLGAAKNLCNDDRFLFVFVGGGTQYEKVKEYRERLGCQNIIQLPYQPKDYIHISLASADFHVVVLNEKTVGFTHPNKIYGAMYVARPLVYIGPVKSYAGNILLDNPGNILVDNGDVKQLTSSLKSSTEKLEEFYQIGKNNRDYILKNYSADLLKTKMIDIITST